MTKYGDLIPGDVFLSESGQVFIISRFDIFLNDRVIRTGTPNAGRAVILDGIHAGKYDGVFRASDPVQLVKLEAAMWQRETT